MLNMQPTQPASNVSNKIKLLLDPNFMMKRQEVKRGVAQATPAGFATFINQDNGDSFSLYYLDYKHPTAFATLDDAKAAATPFARDVLKMLLEYLDQN